MCPIRSGRLGALVPVTRSRCTAEVTCARRVAAVLWIQPPDLRAADHEDAGRSVHHCRASIAHWEWQRRPIDAIARQISLWVRRARRARTVAGIAEHDGTETRLCQRR